MNPTVTFAVRQLLQVIGAYLTFKGYTNEAGVDQAIDALFQLIGPVSFIAGFLWEIWVAYRGKVQLPGGKAVGLETIEGTVGKNAAGEVVEVAKRALDRKPTLWERLTNR